MTENQTRFLIKALILSISFFYILFYILVGLFEISCPKNYFEIRNLQMFREPFGPKLFVVRVPFLIKTCEQFGFTGSYAGAGILLDP